MKFTAVVLVERDGDGYHAYCPALKGLHTEGRTRKEAIANAKDAVVAYLSSLSKHDDPIPIGEQSVRS